MLNTTKKAAAKAAHEEADVLTEYKGPAVDYRGMYEKMAQSHRDISSIKDELAADLKAIKDLFTEFNKKVGLPSEDTLWYFIKNRKEIWKLLKSIITILTKKGQKI